MAGGVWSASAGGLEGRHDDPLHVGVELKVAIERPGVIGKKR